MTVRLHPHARERILKSFHFESTWQGNFYITKEVEAVAIAEGEDWLVITIVTRYY